MTSLSVEDRSGRRWFVITPSRLVVQALVLGSVGVAIGCLLLTSHRGPAWPALVVAFFALVAAAVPDTWAAMLTLATYGTWWLLAVLDVTSPWVVPAAVALLVFHAAVAHAASGPARIATDRTTVQAWSRAVILAAAPIALVFAVVTLSRDAMTTPPVLVGITLLLVMLLLWLAGRRPASSP